jgi:hypothetical protein
MPWLDIRPSTSVGMPGSLACATIGPNRPVPLHLQHGFPKKKKGQRHFLFPPLQACDLAGASIVGPLVAAFSSVATPYPAPSRSAPRPASLPLLLRPLACSVVAAPTHATRCSCCCSEPELYFSLFPLPLIELIGAGEAKFFFGFTSSYQLCEMERKERET